MKTDFSTSQAEASVSLLGAVLRSVEALLCKLTGATWQNQDMHGVPCCHGSKDCEPQVGYMQHGDTNMCLTQVIKKTLVYCFKQMLGI